MCAEENPAPAPMALPAFASSDAEAQQRFEQTRSNDPFPGIPPALLNTADLLHYIAATGMLHPFRVDPEDLTEMLKPASCGMRLSGPVVYWEDRDQEDPVKVVRELAPREELELKRNSIVYVTLEPVLRMPYYIAARFNLTIRDIYRGLLVGTGPLVDPSFVGRISLPLHNLTYNNYTIRQGEPIAWMEFTKLSPNERWTREAPKGRGGLYVPFPKEKRRERETLEDYLRYASSGPITSSIPALVGSAERAAVAASEAAELQREATDRELTSIKASTENELTAIKGATERELTSIKRVSLLAVLAVAAALAAIVIAVFNLVEDSNSSRTELTHQVDSLEHEVAALRATRAAK